MFNDETHSEYRFAQGLTTNSPRLVVTYYNELVGFNDYWSFSDIPSGTVNTYNGNYIHTVTDFTLPGKGIPINISGTFNSKSSLSGIFGDDWWSNLDTQLIVHSTGDVTFIDSTGAEHYYLLINGGYKPPTESDFEDEISLLNTVIKL